MTDERQNPYNELVFALETMLRRADGDDRDAGAARADLARLRRGMGQPYGAVLETVGVIEGMLREDTPCWVAETFGIVAPLFAYARTITEDRSRYNNMGAHFRCLCKEGKPPPANIERRFTSLLNSDPDDLPDALRQAISLLKASADDVDVNWRQLCWDVDRSMNRTPQGEARRREVRLEWSRQFWRLPKDPKQADATATQTQP